MRSQIYTSAGSPRPDIASPDKLLPLKIRSTNPIAYVGIWKMFSNELNLWDSFQRNKSTYHVTAYPHGLNERVSRYTTQITL